MTKRRFVKARWYFEHDHWELELARYGRWLASFYAQCDAGDSSSRGECNNRLVAIAEAEEWAALNGYDGIIWKAR